jgi:hypothetical protein
MALKNEQIQSWLGRQLGSLALAAITPTTAESLLRITAWSNGLNRLGITPPPFLVNDLGRALASPQGAVQVAPRRSLLSAVAPESRDLYQSYAQLIREIVDAEVAERARSWRLTDDLVTVMLAKLINDIWFQWPDRLSQPTMGEFPFDGALYEGVEEQLPTLFRAHPRDGEWRLLAHLTANRLRLLTILEGLDLDTLRLLGLFRSSHHIASLVDLTDLLAVLRTPQANDIVNFSLDVIPSVLETKKSRGMQAFSVDGYAGLSRRGNLDNLLMTEMAHDDLLFDQRFVDHELFYYAHEKQSEHLRRLHFIALDASASMRGEREVFARGLALALVKKLSLLGEDVYFRFFDSMLYDLLRSRGSQFDVPYLLCFRSERGRNYAKVFRLLAKELDRIAQREHRRPILYIVTHAECHIPMEIVHQLKRSANAYGVFILPSAGAVDLDYLELLDYHYVVDRQTLLDRAARADKAREICDDAADRIEQSRTAR